MLDPDLEKYRKIDLAVIVNMATDTIAGGVDDYVRADYVASYAGDRFAKSTAYVRAYPEELPVLEQLLPQATTLVTIINGRHDKVVPLSNAESSRPAAQQPPRGDRRRALHPGRTTRRVRRDHIYAISRPYGP